MQAAFGLSSKAFLDVQDSGAPGLVYVSPTSGFQIITSITAPAMYSLNWYGCPYGKDYNAEECNHNPPPKCQCVDKECTGYCAGVTPHNYVLPKADYYAKPHY
jgi:hypothetical protein